jgi:phage terminase large subunit GpA-like protein
MSAETIDIKTIDLFQGIIKIIAPPPDIKISKWAEEKRVLSKEYAAESGRWRNDRAPYQVEIMDAVLNPETDKVICMTSAQVGKNALLENIMGYYIDIDPCPMLLIEPTLEMAEDYSKRRIAPLIRDTKVLREKVSETKSRDSNNTMLSKNFYGGSLVLVGANSPGGLSSKSIRIVLADEVDRFPTSAGTEGDPIKLAEKRTITYSNRKFVFVSTPGNKGCSRIEDEYMIGTQEKWKKECPHCGADIYINIHGMKYQYSKDQKGNFTVWDIKFECPCCLESFDEVTWGQQPGNWISDNPEAKKVRSFHVNAFVSPWWTWEAILLEYLQSKDDPEKYKTFVNTVLGESYEEKGEIETEDILLKRREDYPAELPDGILILTCGVDVQGDRLEYEIVGWGKGEESWGLKRGFILSDPEMQITWDALDEILSWPFKFQNGIALNIAATLIDSGGRSTSQVYKYCRKKQLQGKYIFACKGMGGPGIPLIYKVTRTKATKKNKIDRDAENCALVVLGVDNGKSLIMSRLRMKEAGSGYMHFPLNDDLGYDQLYFKGLISEKIVFVKMKGRKVPQWKKVSEHVRNEPLDMRNYALAAVKMLNIDFEKLEKRLKNLQESLENQAKTEQKQLEKTQKIVKKRVRGVVNRGIEV